MNKNKFKLVWLGVVYLFVINGCGASKSTAPMAIKDFCKKENAGSNALVEGYVWTGKSVQCKNTSTFLTRCALELYDNPEHEGDFVVVTFQQGNGNTEMEKLPSPFNQNDILIRTDAGEKIGVKDKIRITGHATIDDVGGRGRFSGCYINALKIEKVN